MTTPILRPQPPLGHTQRGRVQLWAFGVGVTQCSQLGELFMWVRYDEFVVPCGRHASSFTGVALKNVFLG